MSVQTSEIIAAGIDRPLVVADIGCRWGFDSVWTPIADHVHLFGFDADPAECERLRALHVGRRVTFVPLALAGKSGRRLLYLTREPACASLFEPDPWLASTMPELACMAGTGSLEVEVTTLDEWAAADKVDVLDFIKLDTQGSELEILQGGVSMLRTARAIEVEVEFNPLYQGQALFGDVDAFLRAQGIVLWRLSNLVHYSPDASRQPQADDVAFFDSHPIARSTMGGQLFWGHAHYVRSEMTAKSSLDDANQCRRDALLLSALGFTDLAERRLAQTHAQGRVDG